MHEHESGIDPIDALDKRPNLAVPVSDHGQGSGPFIVTTTKPITKFAGVATTGELSSRVAVGSLEEARREADRVAASRLPSMRDWEVMDLAIAFRDLPASGGSVDLPDGTRITVGAKLWSDLADEADCYPVPWSHERILAAWNEEQGR